MVNQVAHANGVTDTYGKDPNDMARPASISTSGAATNWATGTYQYDGAGDVLKIGTDTYFYDLVTRLKEGTVGSVGQKQCAVFDAFGNVLGLSQIASGGTCPTTGSYSIDASTNRFLSPVTYDAAGNETYRGGTTYTFDKWSQMTTATGTGINRAYLYTADGERVAERDNAATTITVTVRDLSNKVLRIFAKSGGVWSWSKDYVYRDGSLLASVESTGTKHFHLDHLGTVRRITGTGTPAALLASHDYYPFGLEATSPAQDTERMKYTGHERDTATALDYMHARHYNSGVGRFLSTDRAVAARTLPQSWNRYSYTRGNPLTLPDPDGNRDPVAAMISAQDQWAQAHMSATDYADFASWRNSRMLGATALGLSLPAGAAFLPAATVKAVGFSATVGLASSLPGIARSSEPLDKKIEAALVSTVMSGATGLVPADRPALGVISTVAAYVTGEALQGKPVVSQDSVTGIGPEIAIGGLAGWAGHLSTLAGALTAFVFEEAELSIASRIRDDQRQVYKSIYGEGPLIATVPYADNGCVP